MLSIRQPCITHVTPFYAPFVGGAETYLGEICRRQAQAGYRVIVLTSNAAEVNRTWSPMGASISMMTELLDGVEIIRSPISHLPLAPFSFYALRRFMILVAPYAPLKFMKKLGTQIPRMPNLARQLQALPHIDVLHAANIAIESPMLAGITEAQQRHTRIAATPFVHVGKPTVMRNYVMPHQLAALRAAQVVFVQTQLERDALIALGVPPQTLQPLGMGVNLSAAQTASAERFRARHQVAADEPIILFMGSMTFDKGAIHTLQAMQRLWGKGLRARLVFAGHPPLPGGFEQAWQLLPPSLRTNVLRLGVVAGQTKQDMLAAASMLVMPSRVDSFGIVFLEAWMHRKPVIGASAGGIPDVIAHDQDGFLVPFGEPDILAERIAQLCAEPKLAQHMGEHGHRKVEQHYTWDIVYERWQAGLGLIP